MADTRKLINRVRETIYAKPAAAIATPNRFVTFDTDPISVVASSADDDANGVLLQKAAAGEEVEIAIEGIALVEAGATVATGEYVQASTGGVAIKAATGKPILGRCLKGGANGELISVHLSLNKKVVA